MDDERWEQGMPVLDRQAVPAARAMPTCRRACAACPRGASPRQGPPRSRGTSSSFPRLRLVLGAIAITALELGAGFDSPIVRVCVLLAAPLLLVTTADAALRIWRSAWAWMPVNRGRALFRLAWLIPAGVFFVLVIGAVLLVLGA